MKTRNIFATFVGIIVAVSILLFLANYGSGSYEGIHIERLSDDGFQRYYDDNGGHLNIVKITDDNLKKVPKIKNLINKSLQKEFSLTIDYGDKQETNIQVFSSLEPYEIIPYQKWGEGLGLNKGRSMIAGSLLEYNDQYYHLSFTIA